jgi:hypothetical protein
MDFARGIYDVTEVDSLSGFIRVNDEKGKKSEIRVPIHDNKRLLTEIKKGDKLEIEVKGWQVRSIRRITPDEIRTIPLVIRKL